MKCSGKCKFTEDHTCCFVCKYQKNRACTHPANPLGKYTDDIECSPMNKLRGKDYSGLVEWYENVSTNCKYSDIEPFLTETERKKIMVEMI